ncbi:nitrogen regulatory protein P-II [Proteiniborus sp. DW1]|uniref:P-II family nitrogen regulator n=1 Tax=Proteiniborus sp. DW1 TaxID=1889883 RepID=UPI00092E0CA7|nr:P-II family nitrogen regulator [Proteiniborus sp. DW1]SCG81671.1 nitrogen regulatory protein P-II [Proteiniborus sp. DW1]
MVIGNINLEPVLSVVVVDMGMGSKILNESKKIGIKGGTIFLGRGTVKKPILELLGLDEVKKEIVFMVSDKKLETRLHEELTEKFHLDKPNKGIIFSSPVNRIIGMSNNGDVDDSRIGGKEDMDYEVLFTIVERGVGQEVVDTATAAGSRGATIINARGSGAHEKEMFFSMNIEPEKEIVMMIIEKEKSDKIIKAIKEAMHIDEPGKGVMFAMDVSKTSGLVRDDK